MMPAAYADNVLARPKPELLLELSLEPPVVLELLDPES